MAEDYYSVLGVSKTATGDEIQKAYRRLAGKFHPDLYDEEDEKGKEKAKQKFQQVQHAYDVLSDDEKRRMYDQLGPDFEKMGGQNPFGGQGGVPPGFDINQMFGGGGGGEGHGAAGFEDILRQFGMGGGGQQPGRGQRGQGRRRQGPLPGQDTEEEITISFATAVLGGEHQLSYQQANGKPKTVTVKIPAGIESGKKIRLKGQGLPSPNGGPTGDLFIKIKVAPHPSYSRSGLNLQVTVPVTLSEAIQGAKVDVPTPHGTVTVTVPPGASSGKVLRLKGLGIKTSRAKGDLNAQLQIVLPDSVSEEALEAIKKLDACWNGKDPRGELSW